MKKPNIYQNQSQELLHLFEEAASGEKVMCVPMDYAKKDHLVMFLNGHGDILRKPFSVKNTPEGIAYIDDQVTRCCRRRGIEKKHVFFGGEDANSFAEAKALWLPMSMRMTPKSSVSICKRAPTESICWVLPPCCSIAVLTAVLPNRASIVIFAPLFAIGVGWFKC
jgi:hypothetical protein